MSTEKMEPVAVGEASTMPGSSAFTLAVFHSKIVPVGARLYTASQLQAAVAAERERCAKVCESRAGTVSMFASSKEAREHNRAIEGCAAAIRQLGDEQ